MEILQEYVLTLMKNEAHISEINREHPEIERKLYTDPIIAYRTLEAISKTTRNRTIHEFLFSLIKTRLVSIIRDSQREGSPASLKTLLEAYLKIQKTKKKHFGPLLAEEPFHLLDTYNLKPFTIRVLESSRKPLEKYYQVIISLDEVLSPRILQTLFLQQQNFFREEMKLQTLDTLINQKIGDFKQYLFSHFKELSNVEQDNLAVYATAQTLNLTKTMPLLLDDDVQEIYLDKPGTPYYLDHAIWGRCKTNLSPSESELSHIITRLRLESRKPLDEQHPSLKTELKTNLFHVRAAIDIPPLAYEGPHLNIRKIRIRTLTIPELIANETISLSAAAFLILCMMLRINITISGEPSTGKTTLANAINLLAPPSWRKIAIEDALESISLDEGDRHKVTFRVDPFDSYGETQSTKSNEIIRLLHRSPDWVFLGEIQTAEHSAAMFHAISAGIRGIQTCHANSNEELLLRWKIHHDIPEVCFQSLGLLVHMVREVVQGRIIRKVAQICDVRFESEKAILTPIFEWNKSSGQLEQKVSDLFTSLVTRTCRYQRITPLVIRKCLQLFRETLATLVSNQQYNPNEIVAAFDEAYAQKDLISREIPQTKTEGRERRRRQSSIISSF
ncbi:MAG: ATPase, T2SS/T4P/T4SS family [Promethearchaeota archaeon]